MANNLFTELWWSKRRVSGFRVLDGFLLEVLRERESESTNRYNKAQNGRKGICFLLEVLREGYKIKRLKWMVQKKIRKCAREGQEDVYVIPSKLGQCRRRGGYARVDGKKKGKKTTHTTCGVTREMAGVGPRSPQIG